MSSTDPVHIGRYRVVRKLGEGGFGVVYAAYDEHLDRMVAIKTIQEAPLDERSRASMWREARAAASVSHPNVCQLYEVGEHEGAIFFAMELLEGEPLADRIARGPLPVSEALDLARSMLSALEALHQRGIVHGDLKPSNVQLTPHGLKLLDFGLARSSRHPLDPGAHAEGMAGTPHYMAPEQWAGAGIDARTDLFAVGAMLYEMLTGKRVLRGETVLELCHSANHDEPEPLRGSAALLGVDRVIRRAMAKRPEDRHPSAKAMAHDLRSVALPGAESRAPVLPRAPWFHGVAIGLACGALLAAAFAAGAFDGIDRRIHDWRYQLRGPVGAAPRISLIEADDATLRAFGEWPLPRDMYALLIDALDDAGAAAVAFDILFLGESGNPEADRLLADLTRDKENVVHACSFQADPARSGSAATRPTSDESVIRHGRPFQDSRVPTTRHVSLPYGELEHAARAIGHIALSVDPDGVVRRVPLLIGHGGWAFPSLALRLIECAARRDTTLPQFELDAEGLWMHRPGRSRSRVPRDADGATAIAFTGNEEAFARRVSMLRVLQWYRDGDVATLEREFAGQLVLVGVTAVGEAAADIGAMPFSPAAPLVYAHANAVDALLRGRFVVRASGWAVAAALLVLGAAAGVLLLRARLGVAAACVGALVVLLAALDYGLFVAGGVDVPLGASLALPPLVWAAIEGYRRLSTERQTRLRERELQVAHSIQRRLLPQRPPVMAELEVAGASVSAEAVGGDYYDWIELDRDTLAVVLGDVAGHGVPAALLMSHLHASFHAHARPGRSAREIVEAVHDSLSGATESHRFATFFLALISRREPTLRFVNAGHNPPLLIRGDRLERLSATGVPLGMLPGSEWSEEVVAFDTGDLLVLYSDGVPECSYRREFFGEERLRRRVLELQAEGAGLEPLVAAVLNDVRDFAHGNALEDDVTLLAVRRRLLR